MLKLIIFLRPFARYLFIAWIITIIVLSSIPNIPTLKIRTPHSEIRLDYLMHFSEYGFLTFISYLSLAGKQFRISYMKIFLIPIALILFAILDELHQKLIPGRTCSVRDALSDSAGVIIGMIFVIVVFRLISLKLEKS